MTPRVLASQAAGGGWIAPTIDATPFTRCTAPSKDEKTALIKQRYAEVPRPANSTGMIAALDQILAGKKRIAEQPDVVEDGEFKGKSALAAQCAEDMMMQVGGGMVVGWGRVDPADVYSLLQMQAYNWQVTRRALKIEQAKSSTMLATILMALSPGATRAPRGDSTTTSTAADTTIFM